MAQLSVNRCVHQISFINCFIWLFNSISNGNAACPQNDTEIMFYNSKLSLKRTIEKSDDVIAIDWSKLDFEPLENRVVLVLIGSGKFILMNNTILRYMNQSIIRISGIHKIFVLTIQIGGCILLPIHFFRSSFTGCPGMYDLLLLAHPTKEWRYTNNLSKTKWDSSSLNQYGSLFDSADIKTVRYYSSSYSSYCFGLFSSPLDLPNYWASFKVDQESNFYSLLLSGTKLNTGNVQLVEEKNGLLQKVVASLSVRDGGFQDSDVMFVIKAVDSYYGIGFDDNSNSIGVKYLDGIPILSSFKIFTKFKSFTGSVLGEHPDVNYTNQSFIRDDGDCGSFDFGDCGKGYYQSYCTVKGNLSKYFCPDQQTCNKYCKLTPTLMDILDVTNSSIKIIWAPFLKYPITGYELQYREINSDWSTTAYQTKLLSFSFQKLMPNVTYEIRQRIVSNIPLGEILYSQLLVKTRTVPEVGPDIKTVSDLSRYSVLITVSDFPKSLWNSISLDSLYPYIIKCKQVDNQKVLFYSKNLEISNLESFTVYEFSVAVKNEYGIGLFGNSYKHQTQEDVPTGPPLNFSVITASYSRMNLFWSEVEFSKRKGFIRNYTFWCSSSNTSTAKAVANETNFYGYVDGLLPDTKYVCKIAACTLAGCGVEIELSNKTFPGIPQTSPNIFYGNYINSSSICVKWYDIPPNMWVINESREFCIDIEKDAKLLRKNICVAYGNKEYSLDIHGLPPYTIFKVWVYAKNKAGIGKKQNITVQTDEMPPLIPPKNLTFSSIKTNSMIFNWKLLDRSEYFGVIKGYSILVKAIVNEQDYKRPKDRIRRDISLADVYNGSEILEWSKNITIANATSIIILNLFGNTQYIANISANTKFQGVFSSGSIQKTAEGVPLISVFYLDCCEKSFDSITVCWTHSPSLYLQGTRQGYNIYYKKENGIGVQNASISASSDMYKAFVLEPISNYEISVAAYTSVGEGPKASVNCTTDEYVPDKAPEDLNVLSMQYPDGTTVTWSAIPKENWRGLLLGYRIAYKVFEQGEVALFDEAWNYINTSSLITSIVIKGLKVHARYTLKIAGYTKIGVGPFSNQFEFYTCHVLNPEIEVEYIELEPFAFFLTSQKPHGVMVTSIEQSLLQCAAFCLSFSRNINVVYNKMEFNSEEFENRRTHMIRFPVTAPGTTLNVEYSPIFSTPGYMLLQIQASKEEILKEKETQFLNLIQKGVALFVLYFLLNCLLGVLFYFIEHKILEENKVLQSHKICCFFCLYGIFEGIYLVLMTITTVGYGDKVPVTSRGKFCIIIFTVLGIALTAICVGNLSSAFSLTAVETINFAYPNDKIIAKRGSPEFLWAKKKSFFKLATDLNFTSHDEVYEALRRRLADYALVEQYVVDTHPSKVVDFDILKTYKTQSSNYGVSLGGNYSLMSKCMKRLFMKNNAMVEAEMANLKLNSTVSIKVKQNSFSMVSPRAPLFLKTMYILSTVLFLSCMMGSIYEIKRKKKVVPVVSCQDKKIAYQQELRNLSQEYRVGFKEMIERITKKTDNILFKHGEELLLMTNKFSKVYGVNFKYVAFNDLGVPLETITKCREEIKRLPKVPRWKMFIEYLRMKISWIRLQFNF